MHSLDSVRGLCRIGPWVAAALLLAGDAGAGITGVCPDGSFFIVQKADDIPCRAAKRVEPEDLPPLRPHLLPRPYGWEALHRKNDPNNPYNLIDDSPQGAEDVPPVESAESPRSEPLPPVAAAPPRSAAPPPPVVDPAVSLSEADLRDLSLIVELSQQRAPATFADDPALALRLAHSRSFEPRLHEALGDGGGPILLFSAEAAAAGRFHPNLTFVQGHVAFHPDPADPAQLGLLDGAIGSLAAGQSVLGYVVLPHHVDLSAPMDIYWDDRRLTAVLQP